MLDRLSNEMETIHRAVQGLVAMEESLKGEGGNAIRAFYADCHLPFLQFFKLFQSRFTYVLKQMDAALNALEPDSSGFIREHFLDVEIEQGLKTIAQLTESLTDEANSIMNQVTDIVSLPHLSDNEVQEGVHTATIKRDTTLTQLYEFDANQTTALTPIEQDLLTMEIWISDIEGLFKDGVTSINFSTNQWASLSSKNTLKMDLAQHTAATAGLPVIMGVNGQPTTMLGVLLAGEDPVEFSYGLVDGPRTLYGSSILTLPGMATYAGPIDWSNNLTKRSYEMYSGKVCTVPAPRSTSNPNPFVKSLNSFKEMGTDFVDGVKTRTGKALDSPYDFVNYVTIGASDALISGAKSRANNMTDSPSDFANYMTMGITEMVKDGLVPEEPFSKEHWENSFGIATLVVGGVKGIGSTESVRTGGAKETGKIQETTKSPQGNVDKGAGNTRPKVETVKTSESMQFILKENGYTVDGFLELLHPDRLLKDKEVKKINTIRNQIGIPPKGTMMAKVIPQRDIYNYLYNESYTGVRGFSAVKVHSEKLKSLEENYEGARLDYNNTTFKITNGVDGISESVGSPDRYYGTIEYNLGEPNQLSIPRWDPNPDSYPYTGRGFTGSKEIVLPEYYQEARNFVEGDMMYIRDSKAGEPVFNFIFDGDTKSWVEFN